jgi:hypothetical protein
VSDETPAATPPILAEKHYAAPSVFDVANLMREARRQKRLPAGDVPPICVLDPDGDLVDYLRASGQVRPHPAWASTTRSPTCSPDVRSVKRKRRLWADS